MDALNEIPVFVRDTGVFVTGIIFFMYLLRFSPFAFRAQGTYSFVIGRNGNLKAISEVVDDDPKTT